MMHCLTAFKLNLTSLSRTLLAEARKQNRTVVRGEEKQRDVDHVSQARSANARQTTINKPARSQYERSTKERSKTDRPCFWCGRQNHDRRYCPAKETISSNCNKNGHFSAPSVCLSKKPSPRKVQEVEEEEEINFLGEIGSDRSY